MFALPIKVNGALIGVLFKELVRRAMTEIRNQRFVFEATQKQGISGNMDDVCTSADVRAQAIFAKLLREALPGVGLIGEEGLREECTIPDWDIYVTIDPLDGTKAYVRRQPYGVATMVALVVNGKVASAWIGDVNTLEMYGYRPGNSKVHRISKFEVSQNLLDIPRDVPFGQQYVLLRDYWQGQDAQIERIASSFKGIDVIGSSIGAWFTRLWRGEAGVAILGPNSETPWDSTPVIGISEHLGFVFLKPEDDIFWKPYTPCVSKETYMRDHLTMVVHKSIANQFIR